MAAAVMDLNLSDAEYRKLTSKALIKRVDMPQEMAQETLEIITMAVDKYQSTKNYEAAAQLIKISMDKKFGSTWHCVIGEGMGFDITFQATTMIYIYYGSIGIVTYKC